MVRSSEEAPEDERQDDEGEADDEGDVENGLPRLAKGVEAHVGGW